MCDGDDICPSDPFDNCTIVNPCPSSASNTSYEHIESISVANLTNVSGNDGGYADYTNMAANVAVGSSYDVTLIPGFSGTSYTEFWRIWIDVNKDGQFTNNEIFLDKSSNTIITDQITIGSSVSGGTTVMRIAMQYNSAPSACSNFTYGEVEDYQISISANCIVGETCDDGNPCTTNDIVDNSCNCLGTPSQDTDADGICDDLDVCPGLDDNLIGRSCDDGNPCTVGETYDANCGCTGGTISDADNDGICDGEDQCPNLDDNLIGTSCDDGDACTVNDIYTANCLCAGVPESDTDGDGVCDTNDLCPNFDDNLIGTSCDDGDPCTTGETYDANCGCTGGITQDADNDGICDSLDQCPGHDDAVDNDGNGIPDSCEGCPSLSFNDYPILSYDPGQDLGNYEIQDNGQTLYMDGNSWKAIEIDYVFTQNTVITFDFKSTQEGEIHEIAVDNDLFLSPQNRMVLYGTQNYPGQHLVGTYSGSGDWETFTIHLGNFFGGTYKYFVLTADDDANAAGNSFYRNIAIYEDMNGDLSCDENCTAGTACNDGDPCTANDTYDSACGCTGIPSQDSDGDGVCDLTDQCPGFDDNLIGTSCEDGDACTTGETFDANCGCTGGVFTDADGDGFCVGEDPDDSNACVPDNSNCSGCETFDFNDFETSYGIWNDGGGDCILSSNFDIYANSGSGAVRIRDNSGSSSSMFTDVLDFGDVGGIDFSFSFVPNSMENNEDFFLEVSGDGGNSFTIVEEWNSGIEMSNNIRQNVTVNIPGNLLSTSTVLRIRCDASANSDRVYIDDVHIEICGQTLAENDDNGLKAALPLTGIITSNGGSSSTILNTSSFAVFPNPAIDFLILSFKDYAGRTMTKVDILTNHGTLMASHSLAGQTQARIDISKLDYGQSYIILMVADDGEYFVEKIVKL